MAMLPLNALRAFSVAARTRNFVQAAAELGVSAAAVSQHVRNLETFLGRQLFERGGNRIVLTEAGHTLYPALEAALGDITRLTTELRDPSARTRLVISASPSLGELWLLDRLASFRHGPIVVRAEMDPVDFTENGIDLRLTYPAGLYPEHVTVPLFSDVVVPVCAPSYRDRWDGDLATVADADLIHTDWGPAFANRPSWAAWLTAAGITRRLDPSLSVMINLTSHVIAAAAAGIGVALVPSRLARRDIDLGRLVVVHPTALPMESHYCAVYPVARSGREALQRLLRHLTANPED